MRLENNRGNQNVKGFYQMPIALKIWDFASVWNSADFSEIIFAGTYLRGFLGDFGESEIVYKIETPVWMSGFDNQTTVSILKQGSKTVDWMSGDLGNKF